MNEFYVQIHQDVARALLEDVGDADVTADLLSAKTQIQAEIISRECMVVSGQAWVNEVFQQLNEQIKVEWQVKEGEYLSSPQTLCTLSGPAKEILTGERTALNFLQTLSATATQTHRYVQKINKTPTRLLDTRKTIPGLRFAQKYAVTCGGGLNHRMGLYDAILIKENHILACGSVAKAVELARKHHQNILVEVEVESLIELSQALIAQPDRIMLDNFTSEMLEKAVKMNHPKQCTLEVSGGVTLENIAAIAQLGVDFISVGAITKSIQAIDLSLLIRKIL